MTARISQQQLESYLWGAATLLRGTIDAGDYKQFIFPLLFYKRLCDVFDEETKLALKESGGDTEFAGYPENHRFQIPQEAHWFQVRQTSNNVGKALQSAMRAIEKANPDKLYGIFGDAQWTNKDRLSDTMLRDLIEHFSCLELTMANLAEDELGQGYEYLIKKFADDSGHTAAEFYTNRTVVHLMTEMLDPKPGESIYDPTCGSGGMLLSSIAHLRKQQKEWRNVRLYGQERNLMTSSIARMNCFLHGIEDFQIVRGDTLSEPKLVEGDRLMRFNVVLANPPYSIKQWDRDAFASDPWGRNLYGTPPQGRADYAFWQHILRSLDPKTGRCAILFPHGVLFRQEEAEMRHKLIEADVIDCILGLGPNLFYNSSMQSCIVICRSKKPNSRKNKIIFIDASNEVARERAQSFLLPHHIEKIVAAYREFREQPSFDYIATTEEIRDRGWSLNIPLYVRSLSSNTPTEVRAKFDAIVVQIFRGSGELRSKLAAVCPQILAERPGENFRPSIELSAFVESRRGWQRTSLRDVCAEVSVRIDDPSSGGYERFVGLEHLDSGELKVRRWGNVEALISAMKVFLAGDTLFARRNAYLKRASQADFDGICSGDAIVLRGLPDKLALGFLPLVLNTERFWEFAISHAAGTMSRRVNVNPLLSYQFDLPPISHQRSIVQIFNEIGAFDDRLRVLHESVSAFMHAKTEEELWEAGFATLPVGECAWILDPNPSHRYPARVKDGVPLVSTADFVGEDGFRFDSCQRVPQEVFESQNRRCDFRSDDIVFARKGVLGLARPYGEEKKCFSHTIAIVKAKKEFTSPAFLLKIVRSTQFMKRIVRIMNRNGGVPTLGLQTMAAIQVPLPDLRTQERFDTEMETLEDIRHAASDLVESLKYLRSLLINQVINP